MQVENPSDTNDFISNKFLLKLQDCKPNEIPHRILTELPLKTLLKEFSINLIFSLMCVLNLDKVNISTTLLGL